MERIDKVLARHGFGSRKDVKKLLHTGTVLLNGNTVTDPSVHIDIKKDVLTLDGEPLRLLSDIYLMLNKCRDVVCANKDGEHQTVFDLIDDSLRHRFMGGDIHCMGRLDIDTEGLLILTSDGQLTHRLLSPKTHAPKTYAVTLRTLPDADEKKAYCDRFSEGFWIERDQNESGFDCLPSKLVWIEDVTDGILLQNSAGCHCVLTIYEGKFHQVKRMFSAMGNEVVCLKRVKMGSLNLDPALKTGDYRELSDEEIRLLSEC